MVAKMKKMPKKAASKRASSAWNGHFTVAICSLVLLILGAFIVVEDFQYRQQRQESLARLEQWASEGDGVVEQSSLNRAVRLEYRTSLKLAVGHLKQYQRDPVRHASSLVQAYSNLKIAYQQMGVDDRSTTVGKKVLDKMTEVKALLKAADLWDESRDREDEEVLVLDDAEVNGTRGKRAKKKAASKAKDHKVGGQK